MNHALAVAAALSLGTWALHSFVGGREIAGPLLRSELRPVPKAMSTGIDSAYSERRCAPSAARMNLARCGKTLATAPRSGQGCALRAPP